MENVNRIVENVDHINMMGVNPLIGSNDERLGPRFPDMCEPYSGRLTGLAEEAAREKKISLRRGVYMGITGPCLETRAEYRMMRQLGADLVGMSTVPEVIAANHCGMKVLGLSCVSNPAAGLSASKLSHDDVKEVIGEMSHTFEKMVSKWIQNL